MLDDSEYIKLEGIDDKEMSLRLSLLGSRSSRRISDNSTEESSLQQSINDTVERNPCKRIGLHQVRTMVFNQHFSLSYYLKFLCHENAWFSSNANGKRKWWRVIVTYRYTVKVQVVYFIFRMAWLLREVILNDVVGLKFKSCSVYWWYIC